MKRILKLGLVLTVIIGFSLQQAFALVNNDMIRGAIKKYKEKNYVGCISDLRLYTSEDKSNAVAWYYLGSAYMNIAMQQDAYAAYDKVIELNTVPKLTSYAIQAELCMQNPANCHYQNFNNEEIKQLKANPLQFLQTYEANKNVKATDPETKVIEALIQGGYGSHIHPQAQDYINQERTKIRQSQINENKQY